VLLWNSGIVCSIPALNRYNILLQFASRIGYNYIVLKLIFFDCDGVLTLGNSWVKLHKIVGLSKGLDEELYSAHVEGRITVYDWSKKVEKFYKSQQFTKDTLEKIISTIQINPEAKDLVTFLHLQHIPIAIISGSFDVYTKYVADTLGISIWKANYSFTFNKDGSLLKINAMGDEKLTKVNDVKNICQQQSINPEETLFIGDSFNDIEAFKLTKHGVLYKSDQPEFKKYAWKTITHLQEIKKLILAI